MSRRDTVLHGAEGTAPRSPQGGRVGEQPTFVHPEQRAQVLALLKGGAPVKRVAREVQAVSREGSCVAAGHLHPAPKFWLAEFIRSTRWREDRSGA